MQPVTPNLLAPLVIDCGEVAFEKRSEQAKYRTLSCPRPSTSKPIL